MKKKQEVKDLDMKGYFELVEDLRKKTDYKVIKFANRRV